MTQKLVIHTVVSQMFGQNSFLAKSQDRDDCVIVDPGFDPESIEKYLTEHHLTPAAILNTHGHADHIAGNQHMKQCWPDCPIVIGQNDAYKLLDPVANLSAQFGPGFTSPPADQMVSDGETFEAAGLALEVVDVPGHSQGHVVYIWKGDTPWVIFGGDVLFQGGIGRADFADGDMQLLLTSIRSKLFVLPDDSIVLPGHGDPTTIGDEKKYNPFVGEHAS